MTQQYACLPATRSAVRRRTSPDAHVPRVGSNQANQNTHERGLARAIRAEQSDDLPGRDDKVDAIERQSGTETPYDAMERSSGCLCHGPQHEGRSQRPAVPLLMVEV